MKPRGRRSTPQARAKFTPMKSTWYQVGTGSSTCGKKIAVRCTSPPATKAGAMKRKMPADAQSARMSIEPGRPEAEGGHRSRRGTAVLPVAAFAAAAAEIDVGERQ